MWNRTPIEAEEMDNLNISKAKITYLLKSIEALQSKGSSVYPEGLFPSQRYHTLLPYRREDTNIFFTALIAFTLQQALPFLDSNQKDIVIKVCKKATQTYPLYRSRRGLMTYNFWQNKRQHHFHPGYIFHKLKFLELPDDVDDTALVYLTKSHSRSDILWIKDELEKHANKSQACIKNTFPQFKNLRAYTTWFGKNMYLEFDFCVLCNVMYFICSNKLPFSKHDNDTIAYLKAVILSDLHLRFPFRVAPSYPRVSLILYHITRLITAFETLELNVLRAKITSQLYQLSKKKQHVIDQLLIAISICRITGVCTEIPYPLPLPYKNYFFFNGGLLTAFENQVATALAPFDIFHMKHTCEAYYLALAVEYEVLKVGATRKIRSKTNIQIQSPLRNPGCETKNYNRNQGDG